MYLQNISEYFILSAFNDDFPISENLVIHKDLLKFLNLWQLNYIEIFLNKGNQLIIGVLVNQNDYITIKNYIKELQKQQEETDKKNTHLVLDLV